MGKSRMFDRIPFGTEVFLEVGGTTASAALVDISLQGARVRCDTLPGWDSGASCRLLIPLGEEVLLRFEAEVVHPHEDQMGMKFVRTDPDTFSHLVRLLELNTGDAEKVEEELRILVGLGRDSSPAGQT
jgi:hypothetical protein